MNTQRSVSRYGTSGRTAVWVSARTLCATSTPAAPSVATPAAPPPFMVRLSASTSRAGGVLGCKCGRPDREPLAPLTRGAEIDMDEPRARVEAEAEEPDLPRRRLEGHRVVVRHGDVEGGAVEVLRPGRAADGAVVLGAAIGRADDQRLAQPVAQRLQLVERGFVDQQLVGPARKRRGNTVRSPDRDVAHCNRTRPQLYRSIMPLFAQ